MEKNSAHPPEIASLGSTPQFTIREAEALAEEYYGVVARASVLPSERDQNFLLTPNAGRRHVLKFANSDEDPDVLDFQIGAVERILGRKVPVEAPETVFASGDKPVVVATSEAGGQHLMRLVTWVDGEVMADLSKHEPELLASVGSTLARLDLALLDYRHQGMDRNICWDLKHAEAALDHLPILPAERRKIVEYLISPALSLDWRMLEQSVIHNDANDHNLLVRSGRVSGLIDFGDMVYTALSAEPAIAAAYAMLGKKEPLAAGATLVASYLKSLPLGQYDRQAILPLAIARLCVSVCYAAHNASAKPDDPYQLVTAEPAWAVLEHLHEMTWPSLRAEWDRLIEGNDVRMDETVETLLAERRRLIGPSLSVSYSQPLHIVRGRGAYLIDKSGREYLDCVNNVCHVGHCHPHVVEAGAAQMRILNTNSRYLYELLNAYAERLLATLPDPLNVVYFTNSGSEANELALRLARTYTARNDVAVLDAAYHGTSTTLIDISPYKHNGPGGSGTPPWVHVAPLPDIYRGRHRGADASSLYAEDVGTALAHSRDGVAAFIAESALGCGGQIILPDGFLKAAYAKARGAGALCIADEVQTGMGRAGSHFWMFETQGIVPDIVTIGKPIGNGHPMAAVVTTAAIAQSFNNGMEYFNTFGGNPVSCAIGLAVLDVIRDEGLQEHSLEMGERLKHGFQDLMAQHDLIGDVRGQGLFLGVELVRDRNTLEPAASEADAIVNLLRDRGILLSTDGPDHNVLKVKPPLVFPQAAADRLIDELDQVMHALD
ncbi:MAG: aminotransferase class III-fold pyridoxal phosphate-dependent enzyme [Sphingomonadales bacterium]|nr:aminotransferase class III-fold pyridoxal phosphate-dependent enzyme [Sphingomonadales bacterium]